MTRNPARVVSVMALLLCTWIVVYLLWKPGGMGQDRITYGQAPDMAEPLAQLAPEARPTARAEAAVKGPTGPTNLLLPPRLDGPMAEPPTAEEPRAEARQYRWVERRIPPEFEQITVQNGDTSFAVISRRVYGTSKWGSAIAQANPLVSPDRLKAGRTTLRIPKDPTNIEGRVERVRVEVDGAAPAPAGEERRAEGGGPVSQGRIHTVAAGETLSGISRRYYGSANRWQKIVDANRETLPRPERLKTGMKLFIPE